MSAGVCGGLVGGFEEFRYSPSSRDNFYLLGLAAGATGGKFGFDPNLGLLPDLNLNFLLLFSGWRFCVSFSYLLLNHYRYYLISRL